MTPISTGALRGTEYTHATGAIASHDGQLRIVRFACGISEVECGYFLRGRMSQVVRMAAFGPIGDFGDIHNLSEGALDSLEISLSE
jgi:hypothetical protein